MLISLTIFLVCSTTACIHNIFFQLFIYYLCAYLWYLNATNSTYISIPLKLLELNSLLLLLIFINNSEGLLIKCIILGLNISMRW